MRNLNGLSDYDKVARIRKLEARLAVADELLKDQYRAMNTAYAEYGPFYPDAEKYFQRLINYFGSATDAG